MQMAVHVVLLRGVNLVKHNRIAMPELRSALTAAGFRDVSTYLQSGNTVLSSRASGERVVRDVGAVIRQSFGLEITVIVRSASELAAVVQRNPLAGIATTPNRYLVTFLSADLPPRVADDLRAISQQEPFAIAGREVYSWHPDGIGRTPLWERLSSKSLGVAATSRNWATVTALLAMAEKIGR
jgi:uncharacterized protein (DUF1697 family)